MTPERWDRVRRIFAEAAELEGEARARYLDSHCPAGTPERAQVDRLLAAHDAPAEVPETAQNLPWAMRGPRTVLAAGTVVSDRFRLIRQLGSGGMGDVFEAEDLDLGGRVALKTVRAEWRQEAEFLARFKREIQIARKLTHPHICRVFDAGRHTGPGGEQVVYLTMELLEGETLAERLKRDGPLSPEQASPLLAQILAGLSALHDAGVIHRDLKPGNVMLSRTAQGHERAVLMDFGLARSSAEPGPTGAQTKTGRVLGTPDYMPPEQLVGKPAGAATDLFAFGVVAYELLTGAKPWGEEDRWNAEPVPLRERRRELPKAWEEAIGRCLQRDPAERPQSVSELAGLLGVMPAGASSAERDAYLPRPKAARWKWAGAVFLALLALFGWLLRDQWQGPETAAETEWRIALLPFEAIGGDEALAGSAAGLGDVISRRLSQFDGPSGAVEVVSPREVRGLGVESPSQARDQLGARMVVEGSLSESGEELQLTLAVVNPETSGMVSSATVTDRADNFVGLERKAVARLGNMLSLRLKPENAEAPLDLAPGAYELYVQGLGYLERDDQLEQVEYAEGLFRKALAADPDFADAQAGLAAALWQKFKRTSNPDWIAEAVKEAEKALALDPDQAQAHITLGLAENRRPETQEEALGHFNHVLAADPNHGEALEGLADTYKRMGRIGDAEAAFRDMLARRRGDWRAYKQMALFCEGQGRYGEAIELLQNALQLTPDNAEILGTLGSIYYVLGDFESAVRYFEESIKTRPSKMPLVNLLQIYVRDRRLSKVLDTVSLLTSIADDDFRTWNSIGIAYGAMGLKEEQADAYEKAASSAERVLLDDPQNPAALLQLASHAASGGRRDQAIHYVELAAKLNPDSPRVLLAGARILNRVGEREAAQGLACGAARQTDSPDEVESLRSIRTEWGCK